MSSGKGKPKKPDNPGKPKKMRLDELLVARGLFDTKDAAARACFAGEVTSNDATITGPSQKVAQNIELNVKKASRFVSRGGDKLQGAIDAMSFDPSGMNCIDAGASTGGFTDCLLQNGASHVSSVDVGYGQFSMKLRRDSRVSVFERTNIKDVVASQIGGKFDLLVADLSFISLSGLLPVFANLIKQSGNVLLLVKPEFEIDRNSVEDGGVVRRASDHIKVLEDVVHSMLLGGFDVNDICVSPVLGRKQGNMEFFVLASPVQGGMPAKVNASIDVEMLVGEAHRRLGVR